MNQDQILALVRAVLLIAGTFLVTTASHEGVVSDVNWATITGAVLTIIPIAWSMFAHAQNANVRFKVGSTK
jgi:hypothetical protein